MEEVLPCVVRRFSSKKVFRQCNSKLKKSIAARKIQEGAEVVRFVLFCKIIQLIQGTVDEFLALLFVRCVFRQLFHRIRASGHCCASSVSRLFRVAKLMCLFFYCRQLFRRFLWESKQFFFCLSSRTFSWKDLHYSSKVFSESETQISRFQHISKNWTFR